ncbi:hypothetical protein ACA910_022559 [Epithemia clementina (nom. ined.)]
MAFNTPRCRVFSFLISPLQTGDKPLADATPISDSKAIMTELGTQRSRKIVKMDPPGAVAIATTSDSTERERSKSKKHRKKEKKQSSEEDENDDDPTSFENTASDDAVQTPRRRRSSSSHHHHRHRHRSRSKSAKKKSKDKSTSTKDDKKKKKRSSSLTKDKKKKKRLTSERRKELRNLNPMLLPSSDEASSDENEDDDVALRFIDRCRYRSILDSILDEHGRQGVSFPSSRGAEHNNANSMHYHDESDSSVCNSSQSSTEGTEEEEDDLEEVATDVEDGALNEPRQLTKPSQNNNNIYSNSKSQSPPSPRNKTVKKKSSSSSSSSSSLVQLALSALDDEDVVVFEPSVCSSHDDSRINRKQKNHSNHKTERSPEMSSNISDQSKTLEEPDASPGPPAAEPSDSPPPNKNTKSISSSTSTTAGQKPHVSDQTKKNPEALPNAPQSSGKPTVSTSKPASSTRSSTAATGRLRTAAAHSNSSPNAAAGPKTSSSTTTIWDKQQGTLNQKQDAKPVYQDLTRKSSAHSGPGTITATKTMISSNHHEKEHQQSVKPMDQDLHREGTADSGPGITTTASTMVSPKPNEKNEEGVVVVLNQAECPAQVDRSNNAADSSQRPESNDKRDRASPKKPNDPNHNNNNSAATTSAPNKSPVEAASSNQIMKHGENPSLGSTINTTTIKPSTSSSNRTIQREKTTTTTTSPDSSSATTTIRSFAATTISPVCDTKESLKPGESVTTSTTIKPPTGTSLNGKTTRENTITTGTNTRPETKQNPQRKTNIKEGGMANTAKPVSPKVSGDSSNDNKKDIKSFEMTEIALPALLGPAEDKLVAIVDIAKSISDGHEPELLLRDKGWHFGNGNLQEADHPKDEGRHVPTSPSPPNAVVASQTLPAAALPTTTNEPTRASNDDTAAESATAQIVTPWLFGSGTFPVAANTEQMPTTDKPCLQPQPQIATSPAAANLPNPAFDESWRGTDDSEAGRKTSLSETSNHVGYCGAKIEVEEDNTESVTQSPVAGSITRFCEGLEDGADFTVFSNNSDMRPILEVVASPVLVVDDQKQGKRRWFRIRRRRLSQQ